MGEDGAGAADDLHMRMRGLAGRNGIPVEDCLHNPLVLGKGAGQAPGQAELRPAER